MNTTMEKIAEGKTKILYRDGDRIRIESKDAITAGDGARRDVIEGKARISTATTSHVFRYLNACGLRTAFIEQLDETTFAAVPCKMVPIEVVIRRLATGSYLKRHPEVKEGTRFVPPLVEFFLKDDARHDPQIQPYEIIRDGLLTEEEVAWAADEAVMIFRLLEKAWTHHDVTLVDMKVEFGRNGDGRLILADVIDNDSWRLWPGGDKHRMKDKQVYRNLQTVTPEALKKVKENYQWVEARTADFSQQAACRVVMFMGSHSDKAVADAIQRTLDPFGLPVERRVLSAHKATREVLEAIESYEADGIETVFIAIAGRSNALGPVIDGNTTSLVINCPPQSDRFGGLDVLSSLRMPSGMACVTVLEPDSAALATVKALAVSRPILWGRLLLYRRDMRERLLEQDREQAL